MKKHTHTQNKEAQEAAYLTYIFLINHDPRTKMHNVHKFYQSLK
jgi:hypothetical protein